MNRKKSIFFTVLYCLLLLAVFYQLYPKAPYYPVTGQPYTPKPADYWWKELQRRYGPELEDLTYIQEKWEWEHEQAEDVPEVRQTEE